MTFVRQASRAGVACHLVPSEINRKINEFNRKINETNRNINDINWKIKESHRKSIGTARQSIGTSRKSKGKSMKSIGYSLLSSALLCSAVSLSVLSVALRDCGDLNVRRPRNVRHPTDPENQGTARKKRKTKKGQKQHPEPAREAEPGSSKRKQDTSPATEAALGSNKRNQDTSTYLIVMPPRPGSRPSVSFSLCLFVVCVCPSLISGANSTPNV